MRSWTAGEWLRAMRSEVEHAAWYSDGATDSRPRHRWRCPFAYRQWQRVEQHARDKREWAQECERLATMLVEVAGHGYMFDNTGEDAIDPTWVRYQRRNRPRLVWR